MKPVDAQRETTAQVARVATALEMRNRREQDEAFERELEAMRDVPRITGALRRGLARNLVRNGLFHQPIPRSAWRESEDGLVIRCNCGAEHPLAADAFCEKTACGRWFLFDGTNVRVAVRPPAA